MQVQQLMEQDLVIRSLFGQNQNRRENTADKCGRNTVQDNRPAGGQTVTGTYVRDLFLLSFRYRTPPAEKLPAFVEENSIDLSQAAPPFPGSDVHIIQHFAQFLTLFFRYF